MLLLNQETKKPRKQENKKPRKKEVNKQIKLVYYTMGRT